MLGVSNNLIHLPCADEDVGTQRCRLGPQLMQNLGVTLGDYARVAYHGSVYLCSLWPRLDGYDGYCQFDEKVCSADKASGGITSKFVATDRIELLQCAKATKVQATVVLTSYKDVKSKRKGNAINKLAAQACDLLYGIAVENGATINCQTCPLQKHFGISYVLVRCVDVMGDDAACGLVHRETEIEVIDVISQDRFDQQLHNANGGTRLGGLNVSLGALTDIIELRSKHGKALSHLGVQGPRGVLLRGPPGCGKTSLVQLASTMTNSYLITVNGPDLYGSRAGEGESRLAAIFDRGRDMSCEGSCILFIDELDTVCPRRGQGVKGQEGRMTSQLGQLMDELDGDLVVIGATNRPNVIDPSLRRPGRFEKELFIGVPTLEQRVHILEALTSGIALSQDVQLSHLAEMTPGFVGADLTIVVQQALYATASEPHGEQSVGISMAHFLESLHCVTPSTQRGSDILVDYRPVSWEQIGGLEEVKLQLKQAIEWPLEHPGSFARLGLPRPRGVLLYGPPGCAKTTLVRAAATSCHVTFLSISGAQLYSPYVGDSERKVVEAFQQARAGAPSILFIDEIDSVVGKRNASGKQKGVQERVLSTLLNEMDGIGLRVADMKREDKKVLEGQGGKAVEQGIPEVVNNRDILLVAATNRPDMLDDALLRPGRIDRIIYVPPPDLEARHQILTVHSQVMPLKDVDLQVIADETEGYTGADLENLCREAGLCALSVDGIGSTCIEQRHFTMALNSSVPSVPQGELSKYLKPASWRQ